MLQIAIFDDVIAARRERFDIAGLEVRVFGHGDDIDAFLSDALQPDILFVDYGFGKNHKNGVDIIRELRAGGLSARIVGISSNPESNAAMLAAGADDSLDKKAHLRSYLVHVAKAGLTGSEG